MPHCRRRGLQSVAQLGKRLETRPDSPGEPGMVWKGFPAFPAHLRRTELDDEDYPQGGWDTVFLVALLLLGLPANGLMAWLAGSQARQGAGTRLALLLLSLAVSDFLFLAAAAFQIMEIQHGGHWPLGTAACRFYYFLWGVSYSSGLFLLATLSLDRCLLALCPRWYPGRRPARLPLWVCAGVWVLATLFSVPWLVFPEAAVWWYDLVICLDFWDSEELPLRMPGPSLPALETLSLTTNPGGCLNLKTEQAASATGRAWGALAAPWEVDWRLVAAWVVRSKGTRKAPTQGQPRIVPGGTT